MSFTTMSPWDLMIRAIQLNMYNDVARYLKQGVDPKQSDEYGIALHHAVWDDFVDIAKLLISVFPEGINVGDEEGNTPLHDAANRSSPKCCKLLIECGSDANLVNRYGHQPAQLIDREDTNANICFQILIDYGASFKYVMISPLFQSQLEKRNQTRDSVLWLLTLLKHRPRYPFLFRVVGKDMLRLIALELWDLRWKT